MARLTDEQKASVIRILSERIHELNLPDYIKIAKKDPVLPCNVLPFKRKETTDKPING